MGKDVQQRVYTVIEAATYLGVSRTTLYDFIQKGEIPRFALTDGGNPRFLKDDLDAFIERRKRMAESDVEEG